MMMTLTDPVSHDYEREAYMKGHHLRRKKKQVK